jgi:hypothetical protein
MTRCLARVKRGAGKHGRPAANCATEGAVEAQFGRIQRWHQSA